MKYIIFFTLSLFFATLLNAKTEEKQIKPDTTFYNLGFETISNPAKLPDGWFCKGDLDCNIKADSIITYSGKYSLSIEIKEDNKDNKRGYCFYTIPAKYAGSKVSVRAYLKTNNTKNKVGLILNIEGDDRFYDLLEFADTHQPLFESDGVWKEYIVTAPLPDRAKTINIGAYLEGNGKLWIDDFQVFIDDKELFSVDLKEDIEFENSKEEYNLGFEYISHTKRLPYGWFNVFEYGSYEVKVDSTKKHSGKYSLLIQSTESTNENDFCRISRIIPVVDSGLYVTIKAFMNIKMVDNRADLFVGISSEQELLEYHFEECGKTKNSNKWKEYSVTLPLPENATKLQLEQDL